MTGSFAGILIAAVISTANHWPRGIDESAEIRSIGSHRAGSRYAIITPSAFTRSQSKTPQLVNAP